MLRSWSCRAGLKTFLSLQSTRQLSEHTSAGLGVTWQPRAGLGLQLVSTRELSDTTSADFNWVIGPAGAAGAGLAVSRRGEKLTTSGRIEVCTSATRMLCFRPGWQRRRHPYGPHQGGKQANKDLLFFLILVPSGPGLQLLAQRFNFMGMLQERHCACS